VSVQTGQGRRFRFVRPQTRRNPAAAVYGIVIACAVLAVNSGQNVPTTQTVVSVVGALLIYWFAEAYAVLITSHPETTGARSWLAKVRHHLFEESPFVTAPLWLIVVEIVARALGASRDGAVYWAMTAGVVLLGVAGGHGAYRSGRRGVWIFVAAFSGVLFGLAAILLKKIVHSTH
jgi:hypothetical protein